VLGGCLTQQQIVTEHEDNLAAAGFVVKPANTPERQEMLKRLPPHRFVQRVNGDTIHYIYADPLVCGCRWVCVRAGTWLVALRHRHQADARNF
jgi:hypothetical protein